MTELTWQDPPPPAGFGRRGRGDRWTSIIKQCQARPGQWACVGAVKSPSISTYAKKLGLEAVIRKNVDGSHDLYVRWPES